MHKILIAFKFESVLLILGAAIFACASTGPIISANPNASFANGNVYLQQGIPLLFEYHRLTTGDSRQRYAYPQRNYEFRAAKHTFATSVDRLQMGVDIDLNATLFSAFSDDDATQNGKVGSVPADYTLPGFSTGISAAGFIDSLDFDFNAALYVERHDLENPHTADRQESDWVLWNHDDRDVINYKRMQGHFGLNYAWLRLEMGRDALHWGPGFYNNLTLNRQAVPYGYFSVDLTFGALRVISFYGKLEIDSVGPKIHGDDRRHLYGHRYELALGNATLGMSEIQVIYNDNNPWLLVPVFPQFMEKGNYTEHSNNGAIAFDANYRLSRLARVYGEFYIDDLDSPVSLFENEYLNNQWALLLGTYIARDFTFGRHKVELGNIFEYARAEQFIYSHFEPNEAQVANAGYPLGYQLGPNSQTIDWMLYSQFDNALAGGNLFVGLRNTWSWKGDAIGSDINEAWTGAGKKKDFLGGAKMKYTLTPIVAYSTEHWQCSGAVTLFSQKKGEFNVSVRI